MDWLGYNVNIARLMRNSEARKLMAQERSWDPAMVEMCQRYRLGKDYSDLLREMERRAQGVQFRILMQIAGDLVGAHGLCKCPWYGWAMENYHKVTCPQRRGGWWIATF